MTLGRIHLALLHYPVLNKRGDVVTTAVTNMDIHDISRTARTFGVKTVYIVTPLSKQHELVNRIMRHWNEGFGKSYNPSRHEAFRHVKLKETLDDTINDIVESTGIVPTLVSTSAVPRQSSVTFEYLRRSIEKNDSVFLLIFGTGWGIADEVITRSDVLLEPIRGVDEYNHLPVRAAVAITLDRLLNEKRM